MGKKTPKKYNYKACPIFDKKKFIWITINELTQKSIISSKIQCF